MEEESRLLAASPSWLRQIIIFAINTGLRQSEILNLTWNQISLSQKALTIVEQKNVGQKRGTRNLMRAFYNAIKRSGDCHDFVTFGPHEKGVIAIST